MPMTDHVARSTAVRGRKRRGFLASTLAAALLLSASAALTGIRGRTADAMAGCLPHQNTAEEMTFLSQLQVWRNQHIPGSRPLTLSGPLNAAAAGYAQFLATTPGAAGHNADGTAGYAWATRAINCDYPTNAAAGGEGLATVEASTTVSVSPSQALTIMTSENNGGVRVPSNLNANINPPAYVQCVGVAKMVSSDGHKVAWVTLLFATWDSCPQVVTGGTGGDPSSPSPTATSTSTATPTPTNTPTPTPSPTPLPRFGVTIAISTGWNLVTLPAGPIVDLLARAGGCFTSIYQQQGDHWRRYSPLVPDYANNLSSSGGGAFWINGTGAQGCGRIQL